jgi:hypothetical protein
MIERTVVGSRSTGRSFDASATTASTSVERTSGKANGVMSSGDASVTFAYRQTPIANNLTKL